MSSGQPVTKTLDTINDLSTWVTWVTQLGNAQVGSAVLAASHSAAVAAFAQLGLTPATYMTVQPVTLGQPELQKGAPEAGASRTPIATSRVSGGGRAIGRG